jgi:flagellar hook-associated protein 3 FlgL
MRVTDLATTTAVELALNNDQSAIGTLQDQLASGLKLNRPSDGPTAVVQTLQLSAQAAQVQAWSDNAELASSWLGLANTTANSVLDELQKARTLLLGAMSSGTQSATTDNAIGGEVSAIRSNVLSLANTTFAGRPIFAGTAAGSEAYDANGTYQGTAAAPTMPIGRNQSVEASVSGPALFGTDGTPSQVFSVLGQIATDLSGTTPPPESALKADLANLDQAIGTAENGAASLGNAAALVSSAQLTLTSTKTSLEGTIGTTEDTNIPEATTQLKSDMTVYQSALWAASQAVLPSLVEFL